MKNKNLYCTNCGKRNHIYKYCNESITSYGIILIDYDNDKSKLKLINNIKCKIPTEGIRANSQKDVELFSKINRNIKFLMIRRKHTLGYIEFIRGNYKIDNIDGIIFLFQQMTEEEINKIANSDFDELWNDFWGNCSRKDSLKYEYNKSKNKFDILKYNKNNDTPLNLSFYTDNIKPSWNEPEWGFPKGRRNKNETDIECAIREFKEETGFIDDDYIVLDQIEPLVENLIGTNGKKYRHIYYIAISNSDKKPSIENNNLEIGNICYANYYDGIELIRTYHIDRRYILMRLFNFVMNSIIYNING